MGCSTCLLTGRAPRSTTGNARGPGSGHRLSTERRVQRFAEAPTSRLPACTVTPPQSGHLPRPPATSRRTGGSRPGSLPRHLLMARRMTVMHGRNQPGAVSPHVPNGGSARVIWELIDHSTSQGQSASRRSQPSIQRRSDWSAEGLWIAAVAAVSSRALFPDLADVSCAAPGELLPGGGNGGGGEGQAAGRAQKAQRTSRIFTARPHLIG